MSTAANIAPGEQAGEVRYEYSTNFPQLLSQLGVSLLVSTYQAGKVLVLGTWQGQLTISVHAFEQAMGLAVSPTALAVGTRRAVWVLPAARDLATRMEPAGKHDGAYLTRFSYFTGSIHCHEMA